MWVTRVPFNDTLSAIYWETKGWYLQDSAQSGYNNISLPLMINGSTLKEEKERLFKREQVCFVLCLSTVNICFQTSVWWDGRNQLWGGFIVSLSWWWTNKQAQKGLTTAVCYMCLSDIYCRCTLSNELFFSQFTWIYYVKRNDSTFKTRHQTCTIKTPIACWWEIWVRAPTNNGMGYGMGYV